MPDQKSSSTSINNPHDKFFREAMSKKETAADFLNNYLPLPVVQSLNLKALHLGKDTFIDPNLQPHYSDLLV